MSGLSVSDVVSVSVTLAPQAAQVRNFGSLLLLGDSDIIDTTQRYRLYTSLAAVGGDFGSNAPEYAGARDFFSQSPQPQFIYVGRWAATATHGRLTCAVLSTAAQAMSNFTPILNGGVNFSVDGNAQNLSGLNFSAQTNLNGVATVIQNAFSGSATVIWDSVNSRFVIKSATTGAASAVTFGATGAGTDISHLIGSGATDGGYTTQGQAAETFESCVNTFTALTNVWYGLAHATTTTISDNDIVQVAQIIEASSPSHVYGVTTQEPGALLSTSNTDLAALLQAANLSRTFCQYSSTDPNAAISALGRAFTVNFDASLSTLTLKFKQESGITPETLTETQAAALTAKNCNVWVNYDNNTAILQQGTMANGYYFDEIHGADWFQNQIQTDVYNLLYTSPTKIPQTDAGINQIAAVITQDCEMAVNNGWVAPGLWTGPAVGALVPGQFLSTGFYVYQPPIASQSPSARTARQSPVIQVALKLAGAVHFASVIVNVNR
jgi:Protein of unknown function (DUF3383)